MNLAGTAGVHSLPDDLLLRIFSLMLQEVEVQTHYDRMLRSVPLWLLLVCKRWHTLLSGPSSLFASFCVELRKHKDTASNSAAMHVLLARLRGARDLKICCLWTEQCGARDALLARLLCDLGSLPVLDSLYITLPPFDLTLEQQLGMRCIAQLANLRSLQLESLTYRELQLFQGCSALSCLTCLRLTFCGDKAMREPFTIVLPSFVLQLQRLQSLALSIHAWGADDWDAGYVLPKVDPVACLLILLT